jgi:sugar-specific transcriptional regulator TrmB
MNLQKILQELGLEEKEAKVYLALLGLGEATATTLAEKTALDRTLMYQLATKLREKGLVSYVVKNNTRYFLPAEPETLLKILQEKEKELKDALPELKAKQNSLVPETKVEVYHGRKGIGTIFKMIILDKKPYHFMGGATEACTIFELENTKAVRQAEELKILGKLLARKGDNFFVGKCEDYRFVPGHMISSTTMMIWGSKTAIFVWTEPYYAILINNKEVTNGNLATFNYLWSIGEKPTKSDREKRALKD